MSGVLTSVAKQLTGLSDLDVTKFVDNIKYWVIVASEMVRDPHLHRQITDEADWEGRLANGAFIYNGQVGDIHAHWVGNWLFVRMHTTFAGGACTGRALPGAWQAGKYSVDRASHGRHRT